MTSEDGMKVRKTEIDALIKTDVIEFHHYLDNFQNALQKKLKATLKNAKH